MAGKKPLSNLGKYLDERKKAAQEYKKYQDKNQKYTTVNNKLRIQKTPAGVTRDNVRRYVEENGIGKKDREIIRRDKNQFKNNVNDMVLENELRAYDQGYRYVDYGIENAAKRSKERRNKK